MVVKMKLLLPCHVVLVRVMNERVGWERERNVEEYQSYHEEEVTNPIHQLDSVSTPCRLLKAGSDGSDCVKTVE